MCVCDALPWHITTNTPFNWKIFVFVCESTLWNFTGNCTAPQTKMHIKFSRIPAKIHLKKKWRGKKRSQCNRFDCIYCTWHTMLNLWLIRFASRLGHYNIFRSMWNRKPWQRFMCTFWHSSGLVSPNLRDLPLFFHFSFDASFHCFSPIFTMKWLKC